MGSRAEWRDELTRLEDMGFSTVALADHFTGGYTLEPLVVLTAVAMENPNLRVQTAVLGNDYRHPVLTHRMAARFDVLEQGGAWSSASAPAGCARTTWPPACPTTRPASGSTA